MNRNIKRVLSMLLCLVMCYNLVMPVTAVGESNSNGVTFSVILDKSTLTVSNTDQFVTMTVKASEPVTIDAIGLTITWPESLRLQSLTGGNGVGEFAANEYNLSNGKVSWGTDDAENITGITDLVVATFVIPANSLADEYELGVTGITLSKDYGENWENSASASTILTITDSSSGGESGGTTTSSDYEIWYELDETAPDTENNNAGDNYKEYDISTDAGKTVTATLYIKNKGTAPVSLQAYDIYLTHDSNLTPGTFTPTNDNKGVAKTDDGKFHLQAIGSNTETADININLPEAGAEGNTVELGKLTFTIGANAVYNKAMPITLADNSVNKIENSTNIGIADYITVDGNTKTTGNKESKYPSVGGTTKGAEVMTTYNVTYVAGAADVTDMPDPLTEAKQHNVAYTVAAAPTRTNYRFTGWLGDDGKTYQPDDTYTVNKALTLTAQWQQETVTVTWMNGNDVYKTDTVNSGTAATPPTSTPTKAADTQYTYTFSHWADKDGVKIDTFPALTTDTTYYAVYNETLNNYTVTWYDDNGSQLRQDTVEYGATPSYGTDPTKADSSDGQFSYTFAGWAATKGGNVIQPLPTVDGNEEYYAVFTPVTKTYTVNYDAGAGEFAAGATTEVTVKYGEKPGTIPTPTAPKGYTFTGWSDGKITYKTDLSDFTVSGEVTLTAQYTAEKYIIIFDLNGGNGTKPENIEAEYNKDVTMPTAENFSYTGYVFGGWSVNKTVTEGETIYGGGNTYQNLPYDANKQITLYARWTEDPHTITVTSPETGKVEANEQTAKEGDKITLTATPNAGYVFSSWQVKDADGNDVTVGNDNTFTMPDSNVTVTATFDKAILDVVVTEPAHGDVTAKKNGTETDTAQIGDEITLTSSFVEGYELDKYIVTYKVKNAEGVEETKTVELNEDGTSFTMPGYSVTVTASYKTTDYTIALDPNSGTISADGWDLVDGKYTKTYHIESETIILPTEENMTKTGYTFAGWYESAAPAEGEQSVSQIDKGSTGNKTYYAKWTPNTDTKYTVKHWQMNLGVEEDAEQNESNYTLKDTDNLTGTTDASVTPAVKSYEGFTAPQTQTVTIKPDGSLVVNYYYTRNSYTITFKDGETTLSDLTITKQYGDSVDAPADPTKNGYTFKAWNPAVPTTMPAENMEISATWTINTYTIKFELNGGSGYADATTDEVLTYANNELSYQITSEDKLPKATREGLFVFDGWKVTVTDVGSLVWAQNAEIDAGTAVTGKYGNVTLTAQWKETFTYTVEEYKYAADDYVMLRVANNLEDNQVYQFGEDTDAVMYYIDDEGYNIDGKGVFYTLISKAYAEKQTDENGNVVTDKNGNELITGKLNSAGMEMLKAVEGTPTSINYNGDINGDNDIVNIADANIVYQMIVNGGGYYNNLEVIDRLKADMVKEAYDSSNHRATIADVNEIVKIINGTN